MTRGVCFEAEFNDDTEAMRLLLVEDDRMIGDSLRKALRDDGYAVDWVYDARAANATLASERFDLVLLDLGLPNAQQWGGGLDVLRALRARRDTTPVIVLTARDTLNERVAGLDAGADDYLVKPFDLDELAARMRALLRRSAGHGSAFLEHRGVRLEPGTREVTRNGQPVSLSPREYAVLEALLLRPGVVLSRAQLEDRLYGWSESVESNAVEVYIHGLRRKLGHDMIQNVRGVGYFVPREAAAPDEA